MSSMICSWYLTVKKTITYIQYQHTQRVSTLSSLVHELPVLHLKRLRSLLSPVLLNIPLLISTLFFPLFDCIRFVQGWHALKADFTLILLIGNDDGPVGRKAVPTNRLFIFFLCMCFAGFTCKICVFVLLYCNLKERDGYFVTKQAS